MKEGKRMMLTFINREMMDLKEKLREYNKLKSLEKSKLEEIEKKKIQKRELKNILDKERKDVEKLEALSLSSIFTSLMGNKYEKIDKEKEEYLLAKLKYEDSNKQINKLEEEINYIRRSLDGFENIEGKYEKLIGEKEKLIIKEGGGLGVKLKNLIVSMDEMIINTKEIREAIEAGEITLDTLREVRKKLQSAKGWGTWDILGGGLLVDIGKHSAIDDANKLAEEVQEQLSSFKKELRDVNEFTDIKVNLSSFASFADFFLDGIFADWFVQSKINTSLDNVNMTMEKIQGIINDLNGRLINLEANYKKEKEEYKKIINL